jgi:uncharacterized protein (DUF2147 family)
MTTPPKLWPQLRPAFAAALATLTLLAPLVAHAADPKLVQGIWLDDKGDGAVEIGPCGDKLCGRIIWLRDPLDKTGKPLVDHYNPDSGSKKRPICGLPIIGGLKRQADGSWDAGWIYDPKEGKSYDLEVTAQPGDRLQIKGYMGMKFLSETFIWTRAPANLVRCK